jgi:hypothetical protein
MRLEMNTQMAASIPGVSNFPSKVRRLSQAKAIRPRLRRNFANFVPRWRGSAKKGIF